LKEEVQSLTEENQIGQGIRAEIVTKMQRAERDRDSKQAELDGLRAMSSGEEPRELVKRAQLETVREKDRAAALQGELRGRVARLASEAEELQRRLEQSQQEAARLRQELKRATNLGKEATQNAAHEAEILSAHAMEAARAARRELAAAETSLSLALEDNSRVRAQLNRGAAVEARSTELAEATQALRPYYYHIWTHNPSILLPLKVIAEATQALSEEVYGERLEKAKFCEQLDVTSGELAVAEQVMVGREALFLPYMDA